MINTGIMAPAKRDCVAVTEVDFAGAVNTILTCGLPEYDKPFKTYLPLCPAHRTLAEVGEINIYTRQVIAKYRL